MGSFLKTFPSYKRETTFNFYMENNAENKYICQYCKIKCKTLKGLSRHINVKHLKVTKINVKYKLCPICKKQIRASIINKHREKCLQKQIENSKSYYCEKCGKLVTKKYGNGRFCSERCAKSHILSREVKQRIKDGMKNSNKQTIITCKRCGEKQLIKTYLRIKYCNKCREKYTNNNGIITHRIKNDVELHKTNCPNCNKEIWSKTSDIVYCYECVELLGKRLHQLYTKEGKKLVSSKTCKNISKAIRNKVAKGEFPGWISRNVESYPEKFWKQVLKNNNIEYKFNFPISKKKLGLNKISSYFLDFALNNKIDLEIDGKQHKYSERISSDIGRDKILVNNGWKIYRVEWNEIKTKEGKLLMKNKIDNFLKWYKNQL